MLTVSFIHTCYTCFVIVVYYLRCYFFCSFLLTLHASILAEAIEFSIQCKLMLTTNFLLVGYSCGLYVCLLN